jgi:hypothetical protein
MSPSEFIILPRQSSFTFSSSVEVNGRAGDKTASGVPDSAVAGDFRR